MDQPISLNYLKDQFKSIKQDLEKGYEPIDTLTKIFEIVKTVTDDPENSAILTNSEMRKFFLEEYVGGINKRLVQVRSSQNEDFLRIIAEIILVMSKLFIYGIKTDNSDIADAMRCLFEHNATLYSNHYQSNERILTSDDPSIIDKLPEEERLWRNSLQIGSKLDAIKVDRKYNLKQWAKGEIKSIIDNGMGIFFEINFENDLPSETARDIPKCSHELARYNTMSAGDEWRMELKSGDLIDGYDNTKVWYSSTIVGRETRVWEDDKETPFVKVAFRMYTPEGNKIDSNCDRFYGWSDNFDEWLPTYHHRIQKYQSFMKPWDASLLINQMKDDECDDQLDNLLYKNSSGDGDNNQTIYAVERKVCRSRLLIDFLNSFGQQGGFQLILDKISQKAHHSSNDETLSIGLDLVFYYIDCIASASSLLNRVFFQDYVHHFYLAVKDKILNATELQFRSIKKDRMDQLVNLLINTLKARFMTQKQREQEKNLLMIEIGGVFLEQNFMERRIDGAKLIQEVCKNLNYIVQSQTSDTILNNSLRQQQIRFIAQIIEKVKDKKVIFQMFSRERTHLELVQRSEELLKLLMNQSQLSDEELDLVWSSTKRGEESIKLQMLKVFVEIAGKMKRREIGFIIEQLSSKTTAISIHIQIIILLIEEEIELVHEMALRASDIDLGKMAVDYLWKIAMESNDKQDKGLVNQAAVCFSDIIKYWTIENKFQYIDRLFQNLINNKEGFLSIKMLIRIFKDFINYGSNAKISEGNGIAENPTTTNQSESDNQNDQKSTNTNKSHQQDEEAVMMSKDLINSESKQSNQINTSNTTTTTTTTTTNNRQYSSSLLEFVNNKYDIMQVFFTNFKNYMDKARESVTRQMTFNPTLEINTLCDKCLVDKFIHSDHVTERLEFLKFVAGNSNSIMITQDMLNLLWFELGSDASLFQADQDAFYRFVKEATDLLYENQVIIQVDILLEFFKEKMGAESRATQFITSEGFNCIQGLFNLINEKSYKIIRLGGQNVIQTSGGVKMTSYSNADGAQCTKYSFNQNKGNATAAAIDPDSIDLSVLVHPHDLEGIDTIWRITLNTQDSKVNEKAIALLLKLYTNIAYRNEHRIPEFETCFIERCIMGIKEQLAIIEARTEQPKDEYEKVEKTASAFSMASSVLTKILPPEERRIVKYMSLIRELIKNSEKDGTWGVKPHSSLFKGEYLHTLQINNSVKNGVRYPNKIEIGCYSNMTLWDLRKLIGEKAAQAQNDDGSITQDTPVHPSSIRLHRFISSVDLNDCENGKTLYELKFRPNETLSAYKKNTYSQIKEPLVNEYGTDMSDRAYKIFREWYNQFSINDHPDHPGKRVMTPKTCAAFTRTCTDDNCGEDDSRVVGLFTLYDQDRDNLLMEEDYLRFYRISCLEKEEVVRQNLFANGYRYDLRKGVRDEDSEFIMQVRRSIDQMPRYIISNTPDYFETIFTLLQKQGDVSTKAWDLIRTISTNPSLYDKVLKLSKSDNFKWEEVFDSSSIYKMLYTLQIVESLLEENQANIDTSSEEGQLKADWIQRFLELDGFQQILGMFHKSVDLLGGKAADSLNKFEKSVLEFMLKLIKIFMMCAFSMSSSQNAFEMIKMVKRSSTIVESNNDIPAAEIKEGETDNQYKTPLKQFKPEAKFGILGVAGVEARNLYAEFEQPEMNQAYLFGEDKQSTATGLKEEAVGSKMTKQEDSSMKKQGEGEQTDLAKEMERFAELANVMRNTGLGEIILEKIDFKELQNQVLEIVCIMLGKKDVSMEDYHIIENAMSLWVASVLRNEELIDDFYNYERSEEKAGKYGIRNAEELIIAGIYSYKNFKIREDFSSSLNIICSKVRQNKGRLPLFYVLNLLKNNFPKEDQYYATRECKQFFELFNKLVDEYFTFGSTHPKFEQDAIDAFELLKEVIEKMKRHETKEKKTSILEDKTLIGYMDLIKQLINFLNLKDKAKMLSVLDQTNFIHDLFYENLFQSSEHTKTPTQFKCKTKEARASAFLLLQSYIQCLEPQQLANFMDQYLWPLIKDVQKPKKWCYQPSEGLRMSQFVGIVNLGCICYMNSMLQQFFMVPAFRYQLLKAIDMNPEDFVDYKGMKIDDSLLRQLQKLFGYLQASERSAYDPTEFCFAFKDLDGNPTNTSLQQDAQEFLSIFFDRCEELLRPTSQKHLLEDVFGFKICSQLICQSCGNIRNLLESQYTLSLQVKDRKGTEDSLHKMIEGSIINDFQCEACNQRVDVFKRNLIGETPNVLILHLQRIVFNFDTFQNDKINSRFEFPNILSLKEYSFKEVMKNEGRPQEIMYSEEMKHLMAISDDEYTYKLVGVNIHIGTAEHGHYYSLINTKRGSDEVEENKVEWTQTDKDPWKQFEDDKIKHYSFSDLKLDSFGGNQQSNMNDNEINAYLTNTGGSFGKNAYMLVYERKKKKPLTEIITEDEIRQQMMVMETEKVNTQSQTTNEASDALQSNKRLIDFRKVAPVVPDWIKTQVERDNSNNLIDQQIFSEGFFNMIKFVFKHIGDTVLLGQHRYGLDTIPYFNRIKRGSLQIARKTMFDMLAYFFHNTQMSDITSSLGSIIQFCDSYYSIGKGDDSLIAEFIKEQYLSDNCQSFFHLMFNCQDKTSRFYIGKFTTQLINKAFQICYQYYDNSKLSPQDQNVCKGIKDLQDSAERFLYLCIIALQSQDCQKGWSRLEHYLKLLQEIGLGGKLQITYLLKEFDIVVDLIDFMLGNKSPRALKNNDKRPIMGAGMTNAPFENLVILVSNLIRYSLTEEMKNEESKWNDSYNLPPYTLLGYTLKENREELGQEEQNVAMGDEEKEKFPMSQTAVEYFTNRDFMNMILKDGLECEEFGKGLAHFCYKNSKFSRKVAKLVLNGISKNDYDKVKNYLDIVTAVALLRDEFQEIRLEWIFGIALMNSASTYCQNLTFTSTTKLGIQLINSSITEEITSFKSSLLKPEQDDALLNLLWRYKNRINDYTINCLQSLINLLAQDERIAEHFSQLPGPTYCYARYTDWIKPYLHSELLDARKGYHGSLSQSKEETIIKALSLYDAYEKFLKNKDKVNEANQEDGQEQVQEVVPDLVAIEDSPAKDEQYVVADEDQEENVMNLISSNFINISDTQIDTAKKVTYTNDATTDTITSIHCEPRPYIIIEVQHVTDSTEKDFDGVILVIQQLQCLYTMSYPTGKGNLSVPPKLFKRDAFKDNVVGTGGTSISKREQELLNRSIGGQFASQNINKGSNTVGTNLIGLDVVNEVIDQITKNPTAKIPYLTESGAPIFNDNAEQWVNNSDNGNNNSDDGGERMNNISDDEQQQQVNQQIMIEKINAEIDAGNLAADPQAAQSYNIQINEGMVNQEDGGADPSVGNIEEARQGDSDQQAIDPQNQYDDEPQADPTQINWPYGINSCSDLVYKFFVINNRDTSVKCRLNLSENEYGESANLYFPKGGLKGVVHAHQTKTFLLVPKIIPTKDYYQGSEAPVKKSEMETQKLKITLFWKEKFYQQEINNRVAIYPQPSNSTNDYNSHPSNQGRRQGISIPPGNLNVSIPLIDLPSVVESSKNEEADYNDDAGNNPLQEDSQSLAAPEGFKSCMACTMFNEASNTVCELCQTPFN